jgi:hypothetical protein
MSRLVFAPEGHTYTLDGKPIPCVSSILKAEGKAFYAKTAKAMESIDRGSRVHQATEILDTLDLEPDDFEDDLVPFLKGWKNFLADSQVKILQIESRVWSEKLWYAGTFDRIVSVFGQKYILDIKTGGKQKDHPVQCAAYALAYEEMTGEKIIGAWVVYLGTTKKGFTTANWRDGVNIMEPFEPYKQIWLTYVTNHTAKQNA